MKKDFNVTGRCYPDLHYMMDNSAKIQFILNLIEKQSYFVINRPRQYGKTTALFAVEEKLLQTDKYVPIRLNFQGIDQKWYKSDSNFAKMLYQQIANYLEFQNKTLFDFVELQRKNVADMNSFSVFITKLVHFSAKKLVLLIDEVDASGNYMPFLSFLGMLRTKYLDRTSLHNYTFYSVVLVGVHDVKSLKYKIRKPENAQYDSPWNIAVNFETEMEFNPTEIAPMLADYSQAENVSMNVKEISEKLYFYTSGYPFLVSRLCQIMAEKVLPQKQIKTWEVEDLEKAIQIIQKEVNTNFESLIKNLENHQDLYDLVFNMLINGKIFSFDPHQETIRKGMIYGIFRQEKQVEIHNRIYEQIVYNYLVSNVETKQKLVFETENPFLLPDQSLDFERVLQRFQAYMKENFNQKDKDFLEKQWRLIFLAFIKPIINGKGFDFKETQISDEKRLDVVITYGKFKYVVELKIWRGQDYHEKGVLQLADYLEKQSLKIGFLVIFDPRKEQIWQQKWIETEEKRIFAIWV